MPRTSYAVEAEGSLLDGFMVGSALSGVEAVVKVEKFMKEVHWNHLQLNS